MEVQQEVPDESTMTRRKVSPGAESWLYRPIQCLDYGFVRLVDYMGSDDAIVQAARVSYGKGTKKLSEDRVLIRYLLRHRHTTPFEMVEFKFHIKMPIFVMRQWVRHRTANMNEYSGRYSVLKDEFYLPEKSVLQGQSKTNKQGRSESLPDTDQEIIIGKLKDGYRSQYADYDGFLNLGLAKEVARVGLPVATYTECYWKMDLHNLMHFLKLRLDSHAQYEIRVFAEAIASILKVAVPMTYEAFTDYSLESALFSKLEMDFLRAHPDVGILEASAIQTLIDGALSGREREEFVAKLIAMGWLHVEG